MKPTTYLLFALSFLLALDVAAPAHAYLDPGTGAMFLQIILGGVAGAVVVCRLYWQRFKALFGRSGALKGPAED